MFGTGGLALDFDLMKFPTVAVINGGGVFLDAMPFVRLCGLQPRLANRKLANFLIIQRDLTADKLRFAGEPIVSFGQTVLDLPFDPPIST